MPTEYMVVSIFIGKGGIRNYRSVKFLELGMKVVEGVIIKDFLE